MEMSIKEADIVITLKASKTELEHIYRGMQLGEESDTEDCGCGDDDCFNCSGLDTFYKFKNVFRDLLNIPNCRKKRR